MIRGMKRTVKVAISLPKELLSQVDRVRRRRGESRSQYFRDAAAARLTGSSPDPFENPPVTPALHGSVQASAGGVSFSYGSDSTEVDYLVIAAGRGADVEGLGLAEAGVELDESGLVRVDGALRTSRRGVYAIGDLVSGPALAHKASEEGIIAVEDSAGLQTHPLADVTQFPAIGVAEQQKQHDRDPDQDRFEGVGKTLAKQRERDHAHERQRHDLGFERSGVETAELGQRRIILPQHQDE